MESRKVEINGVEIIVKRRLPAKSRNTYIQRGNCSSISINHLL